MPAMTALPLLRRLCTSSAAQTILGGRAVPSSPAVSKALGLGSASQRELNRLNITAAIERFRRSPSDTGSPEVQTAILTERIRYMTEHAKVHRQDKHNRRSLVLLVNQRRSMMQYLLRKSPNRYIELVRELGLRPSSVFSKDVTKGAKKQPTPKLHSS